MSQPVSREQLLREWKARKAAGGPAAPAGLTALQTHNNASQQQPQPAKPAPGLPPRLVRGALGDKENAGYGGLGSQAEASNGGRQAAAPPDSARKAFATGEQQQQMQHQFDVLQGRLQALKRESVRPSISGAGPPAAAAPRLLQSTASTTLAPDAAARAPFGSRQPMELQPKQQEAAETAAPAAAPPPPASSLLSARGAGGSGTLEQPADSHAPALPSASGLGGAAGGVSALAARLESLKRESVRPSLVGGGGTAAAAQGVQFEAVGQIDAQALSRLAIQLFDDEQFKQLCDKGMNMQLTRSKDGGNADTKIQELAGIVKLLRRGMKELQAKSNDFIAAACRFEKDVGQQVESVRLSSESDKATMQVELATARKEAAAAAAQMKHALANWQSELDLHKGEAARLKREMERVEGERERLREEARKLESAKQGLEAEIKEMRKVQKEAVSELKLEQNTAKQAAYEIREAAERRQQQLSEALAAAQARGAELEAANAELTAAAEAAQRAVGRLEKQLGDLQADHLALQEQHDKLQEEHAMRQREHDKMVADSAVMLGDLQGWQERAEALLGELERERTAHAGTQAEHAAALAEKASLAEQRGTEASAAEADRAAAAQREEALLAEKAQLKAAVQVVTQERDELQGLVKQAAVEMQEFQRQVEDGQKQQASLKAEVDRLSAQVADRNAALEAEQAARCAAVREAKEKGDKLERLENELEALQECTIGLGAGDQKEMLSRMLAKIAVLEAAVAAAEAARRECHNQLVELKGNIRVFCRIRPNPRSSVMCLPDGLSVRVTAADGKDHGFGYDRVFGMEASQADVFEEVSDLVQSALDGFKVCLFSYGQTGAGKTHTMQGNRSLEGQGIIPRAISKILDAVAKLRDQGWEYRLEASFIEVYNEQLRDLLAEGSGPSKREAGKITENNAIQHQPNGGHTIVLGASRLPIESEQDAEAITRKAAAARVVEATAMNAVSSRSHSVFMLYITGRHEATSTVLQGSLNLVDLAGSERLARSQAEGQRAKEACNINKSLSSLGDVFQALATKSTHIPYRNSKLTHLLQPCLGGSGKTLMFVNINPEPESVQETLCSLRFASKVNQCETAAKGGAQRNISTGDFGGVGALTGRGSIAPTDAEARRMSSMPSGMKRKPGVPPAAAASRGIPRPRMG